MFLCSAPSLLSLIFGGPFLCSQHQRWLLLQWLELRLFRLKSSISQSFNWQVWQTKLPLWWLVRLWLQLSMLNWDWVVDTDLFGDLWLVWISWMNEWMNEWLALKEFVTCDKLCCACCDITWFFIFVNRAVWVDGFDCLASDCPSFEFQFNSLKSLLLLLFKYLHPFFNSITIQIVAG